MAAFLYKQAKKDLLDGTHDWDDPAQTYKVILVGTGYVPNAAHVYVADLGAVEVSGPGYVAGFAGTGRKILTSRTVNVDPTFDRSELDADDIGWLGIDAGTVAGAVIYRHLTSDADSKVIAYIDSGGFPIATDGGDVAVAWNVEGIVQLT